MLGMTVAVIDFDSSLQTVDDVTDVRGDDDGVVGGGGVAVVAVTDADVNRPSEDYFRFY